MSILYSLGSRENVEHLESKNRIKSNSLGRSQTALHHKPSSKIIFQTSNKNRSATIPLRPSRTRIPPARARRENERRERELTKRYLYIEARSRSARILGGFPCAFSPKFVCSVRARARERISKRKRARARARARASIVALTFLSRGAVRVRDLIMGAGPLPSPGNSLSRRGAGGC